MSKNEFVAMILAGGRGTRLEALTKKESKPAVGFGGKYRIIDFPLSNAAQSGISHIGVLTQYESITLSNYVGNGAHWGMDGNNTYAGTLPPRQTDEGLSWYSGTANAIWQNVSFLDSLDPEYVLILSGDHIYKMDYQKMLDFHKEQNADLTVAVLNVSLKEASRFGIMNTNPDSSVYEFEEKPKNPKSTLASMGIYIFNYKVLRKYLSEDSIKEHSDHDFGKDIIPTMLNDGKRLFAYRFDGYWKDVGTVSSLWQANMDLLDEKDELGLYNHSSFRILSEDSHALPQYVGANASVKESIVNQGAIVLGSVTNSVIFTNAVIEEGAVVVDSVIMSGAHIGKNAKVYNAIVADNVCIKDGALKNLDNDEVVLISE